MATKKIRVWIESEPDGTICVHRKQPTWRNADNFWVSQARLMFFEPDDQYITRFFGISKPRGRIVSEYEVTVKLVKKIRPPKQSSP